MIRVLLADDQTVVRAGFRVFLELTGDIEIVGEATSGPEAVRLSRERRPDVVCMDVRMPGGNGLDATREIVAGPEPVRPCSSSRPSTPTSTCSVRSRRAPAGSSSRTPNPTT